MPKKIVGVLLILSCLLVSVNIAWAGQATDKGYLFWNAVTKKMSQESWKMMGAKPENIIVLTNSSYVKFGDYSPQATIDGLSKETGCTVGKGNLLEVHAARTNPLWFVLYDKESGKSVYCVVNKEKAMELLDKGVTDLKGVSSRDLFSKIVCENIKADYLFAHAQAWDNKTKEKVFDGNEFRIVTIVNAAAKGAPVDFMNGVLYHDHFCPGVTSGYLLANFLEREMPLRSASESYFIISAPVWCKEDALQTVLNTTPGKSGMAILPMNAKSKEQLLPEAKNLAGIYFRTDRKTKKSEALVLTFDFAKGAALSGLDKQNLFEWEKKVKTVLWELDNLDKPELFITVLKRFELQEGETPMSYVQPGVNPLAKLGLVVKE
ncbi:FmdE, Molybdenum formylmethanofuran dehydrogenase operon [Sporomusa ovata DSM 2662]|uniref:Protein containing a metal-binding domain shared with formylmethanofuran dehydrogenase subunit E n=1 Tax=Sporomusa ovata TaxID=2378 RepID=A0A0U1L5N9_9FIRM|nr:FmdE family protein [Sporomusa ovata]EQB25899.1 molybdenum formylmethanofuran dehydrogenase FmdE [Sporomusa ovata DSM 2662]CQR74473.1 Protein containing a metal-binding domain shared with formylmethanofuran dehydrogenase subunit E [Sporomusa ovata]